MPFLIKNLPLIPLFRVTSVILQPAATAIPESFGYKKAYLASDSGTLSLLIHGQKITSCQVVRTSVTLPPGVAPREAILETRFTSFLEYAFSCSVFLKPDSSICLPINAIAAQTEIIHTHCFSGLS